MQECVCACMCVHCWHIVEFASLYTPPPPTQSHPIIIMKHILNHKHKLWLLFRYLFHPRVTAVARKRPQSLCQKWRWQVTAKHACGFAWSDMVHGCMVYTERAEMAAVSCGTSHASHVHHFGGYLKKTLKKKKEEAIHSCRITCEHSESAREWRIVLYKSDQ